MKRDLDTVTNHYIECAVWADAPEDEENNGVSEEFRKEAREDCAAFIKLVEDNGVDDSDWTDEQFGHDFWLTRCGHGAGFWDRGHGGFHSNEPGGVLTRLAKTMERFGGGLYVGDDGMLYAG